MLSACWLALPRLQLQASQALNSSDVCSSDLAELFSNHCAGCHVNGGNIIRRGQTLKLAALERHGINGPAGILEIAVAGRGQMAGYGAVLGETGAEAVAAYVWQQALLDWPRG